MIAASETENLTQLAIWAGILLAAFVALAIVAYVARNRARGGQKPSGSAWNLSDLADMRDRGDLTDEEYRTLRAQLMATLKGRSEGAD